MLAMNPQTIGDERTLVRQIILLSLAAFASAVSARISDPLLPQLAATFLLSTGEAAHAVSAFALAYGLLQLCYGPLGDRYGKYRVITLACLACTLGGLGSALAFGFPGLGAFRFLLARLGRNRQPTDDESLSLGGIVALTAVFAEAANAVVASLDAGRLNHTSAALVGLRVLATDIAALIQTHIQQFALPPDEAIETMLSDIAAVLGIARGPRQARQARLASPLFNGNAI